MTRKTAILCIIGLCGLIFLLAYHSQNGSNTLKRKSITYCLHNKNPPEKLEGLPQIASIDSFSSVLVALDQNGYMWTSHQGDSCEPVLPSRILATSHQNLINPQVDRLTTIFSGSHYGGYASTQTGQIVHWYPQWSGLAFNGIPGVTSSCNEAETNCLQNSGARLQDITDVSAGGLHSLFLRSNGEVWSHGRNDCGQLGRAEKNSPPDFLGLGRIDVISDASAISAGYKNSLALKRDGTVWEWGNTSNGYLRSESGKPSGDFQYCRNKSSEDAEHQSHESAHSEPWQVVGLSNITAVSAFYAFNLALKDDGTVWGWGQNDCGQLGKAPDYSGVTALRFDTPIQIEGLPPIRAIAAGKRHSLALDTHGGVWAWGYNNETELGSEPATSDASQACAVDDSAPNLALFMARPLKVPGLPRIKAITAAYNFSAALDEDGEVWVWGKH